MQMFKILYRKEFLKMEETTPNIAYGLSLIMKTNETLSQGRAAKDFKKFLNEIEPFIDNEEFWELTEIENSINLMKPEEFNAWKKIASEFYFTKAT